MVNGLTEFVLPRLLMAGLAGMLFAQAATWLQALTQQRIVSPDILGVSSCAIALMLMAGLVLQWPAAHLWLFGLLGSSLAMAILLYASRRGTRSNVFQLVMVGVALNMVLQAAIAAILAHADSQQMGRLSFVSGSDYAQSWQHLARMAAPALLLLGIGLLQTKRYQLLQLSSEQIQTLGVCYRRLQQQVVVLACAQVTVAVVCMGNLSFVGLIIPNAVYAVLRQRPQWILLAVTLAAALIMPLMQWLALTLWAPLEIPLGLLTSMIGAPLFLFMIIRQRGVHDSI